jgi:hypothetical protein
MSPLVQNGTKLTV